jgi:hypothetical protein
MVGFPHSEILGSKLIRSSPGLIAAYYVLHRLHAPRHPLDALKTLDRSHYRCPPLSQPLLKRSVPRRTRTNLTHTILKVWIGFDRSDQKRTRIHVLLLSLGGVRLKRAAKHLFTMSKDPAADYIQNWMRQPNLLSISRRYFMWLVEPDGIEPTT